MFIEHTLTTTENTKIHKILYSQNLKNIDSFEHKNKLVRDA